MQCETSAVLPVAGAVSPRHHQPQVPTQSELGLNCHAGKRQNCSVDGQADARALWHMTGGVRTKSNFLLDYLKSQDAHHLALQVKPCTG